MLEEQHRGRFDRVTNQLGNELVSRHGGRRLKTMFETLLEAARQHFRAEEFLMLIARVGDQQAHREQHYKLLADLKLLQPELDRRSVALTMRYLEEWLMRHINGSDRQNARLLRESGVS